MTICRLRGCLPEIIVTVEDIRVVDGHHFVAAKFDGQLLQWRDPDPELWSSWHLRCPA